MKRDKPYFLKFFPEASNNTLKMPCGNLGKANHSRGAAAQLREPNRNAFNRCTPSYTGRHHGLAGMRALFSRSLLTAVLASGPCFPDQRSEARQHLDAAL